MIPLVANKILCDQTDLHEPMIKPCTCLYPMGSSRCFFFFFVFFFFFLWGGDCCFLPSASYLIINYAKHQLMQFRQGKYMAKKSQFNGVSLKGHGWPSVVC